MNPIISIFIYRSGRDDNGFIRDDHRVNGSSRQSRNGNKPSTPTRNGKQTKSPKYKGNNNSSKRRNSRQRKLRNQNSKTEGNYYSVNRHRIDGTIIFLGTPSLDNKDLKSTTENELTDEQKKKSELKLSSEKPLPPRDETNKENQDEIKRE